MKIGGKMNILETLPLSSAFKLTTFQAMWDFCGLVSEVEKEIVWHGEKISIKDWTCLSVFVSARSPLPRPPSQS